MAADGPRDFMSLLSAGRGTGVVWTALGSVAVAEIAARSGADALVIDLQHGLWDRSGLEAAVGLSRPHCPVLVRVEENRPAAIGRALDTGADGVIVPLVDSAAEAAQAVAAARFPPEGTRSGGGVRPLVEGFGAYVERARRTVVCVMIETVAGVEAAEAIAATAGVDLLLVGTGDLLLSCGGDAARREDCARRVLAAARAAGIPAGVFTADARAAGERRSEGWSMTVVANDIDLVRGGLAAALSVWAPP
jgi:2-dehydro-3-deoxyglucarate aldolase/4-hydroxy-2-oxoheptanedioate aldolase